MATPFVAEIRIFGCNFAPTGWAQCNGQLLPLSQNTALFSLLGTYYGGDGKSTFALPNLTNSAPIHVGGSQPGNGLSEYFLGQVGGTSNITLLTSEMPLHTHSMMASTQDGGDSHPQSNLLAQGIGIGQYVEANSGSLVNLNQNVLPPAGGGSPHNNMMPFLVLNYCIALQGVFPPRS